MEIDVKRLISILNKSSKKGIGFKDLAKALKVKSKDLDKLRVVLKELKATGKIVERKNKIILSTAINLIPAIVTRVHKTFGFVATEKDSTEYFIPGKFLMGAMPNDKVLIKAIVGRGEKPEGEVLQITSKGDSEFTGKLVLNESGYFIEPDSLVKSLLAVSKDALNGAAVGDKVLAEIVYRGERHSQHRAAIIMSYGNSNKAYSCAESILSVNNILKEFPQNVLDSAKFLQNKGIKEKDLTNRTDFRSDIIFTIDGADSKDLDDAISLDKYDDCYILGVHIADVSHYVKAKSDLDMEAYLRGTSIYYANKVIPMLPPELSNGICSLNPNEDRLALSAVLTLDLDGHLIDFDFKKSVIRSRVKGVYDEINKILDKTADAEILEKYKAVMDKIFLMKELADIRTTNKKNRGAPEIVTHESKIIVDENEIAVDIKPRLGGALETLIEEFMLLANEACAMVGKIKDIPFVYRVHEHPSAEKLENLNKTLKLLGLQTRDLTENVKPKALAEILDKSKNLPIYPIINVQVLRSMAKAKYSENPIGHFGLALENYAHFTSPIRRYPDLFVHRVISDIISGNSVKDIYRKHEKFAPKAAKQATQTELNAMKIERQCEDCYKAEYMLSHIDEIFEGMISSVARHGLYVELPNTVEGLVRHEDLPGGHYVFDEVMEFKNVLTGQSFKIGDRVKVKCTKADVNGGNIDFMLVYTV